MNTPQNDPSHPPGGPAPTLLASDRARVLSVVEQLLRDNAGNRITGALVLGIVTAAERSCPAIGAPDPAPPAPGAEPLPLTPAALGLPAAHQEPAA